MVTYFTCTQEEWRKERDYTIGGSDAAAVVGLSPNMSNIDLWETKTGRKEQADISGLDFVQYGVEAEKYLRALFALDHPNYVVEYEEGNMWRNSDYPFAHASLDGWLTDENGRKGILEIKTTNILNPTQKLKWDKRIPDNYYVQILHYFMVTGFEFAALKAQIKYNYDDLFVLTKHYKIERSEVLNDIAYLAEKEKEFYKYIHSGKRPPLVLPPI